MTDTAAAVEWLRERGVARDLEALVHAMLQQRPDDVRGFAATWFSSDGEETRRASAAAAEPSGHAARPSKRALRRMFPAPRASRFQYDESVQVRRGHYGTVRRATDTALGRVVAVKEVSIEASWTLDEYRHLMACQGASQSAEPSWRVVRCFECLYDPKADRLLLVLEWIPRDLQWLCAVRGDGMEETEIAYVVRQVLAALAHMNTAGGRVHLDVKPANILIDMDDVPEPCEYGVVLADLGTAQEVGCSVTQLGDFDFMAPEVYHEALPDNDAGEAVFDPSNDSWAVGCLALFMAEGTTAYNTDPEQVFHVLRSCYVAPSLTNATNWSPHFTHFVAQCFARQPCDRPPPAELLSHPFVRETG